MRWRLLGLFFFGIAASVAWSFWWRPQAEVWLKGKIESTLSQELNQDVHLDALSLHPLFLRIQAKGLRVGAADAPIFTCKKWTFHTAYAGDSSPVSLFFLTFVRSELDNPTLYFFSPPSGKRFQSPRGWWRKLPLHRLTWTRGSFVVPQPQPSNFLKFTDTEGTLQLSPGGFLFTAKGGSSVGPFLLSLSGIESFRRGTQLDVRGTIRLTQAPLAYFTPWLPARFGRFLGWGDLSLAGVVKDFSVDRFDAKGGLLLDAQWEGDVHLKDTLWFPPTARPKDLGVPLEGKVFLRKSEVEMKDLTLFRSLHLSGLISLDRQDVRWRGEEMDLAALSESGVDFLRWVPSRGTMKTEGTFKGSLKRPDVVWSAVFREVGFPGVLFPELKMEGKWKENWITIRTDGMGGQLSVGGPLSTGSSGVRPPTGRWTVGLASLDMASLAKQNGWPHVGGKVNGSFSLENILEGNRNGGTEASGKLKIDGFNWGIHKETAPVGGRLLFNREGLRVQGDQGAFDLDVRRSSGVWRLDRLDYTAGRLRVWGGGYLRDHDGEVRLEGGLEGLELTDIPPFVKQFPAGEGTLSGEGRLHGSWKDPVFSGAVRSQGIRWRPGGYVHKGEVDFRGGKGGVTLTKFRWDNAVSAEGAWLFGKGWRFSAEVEKTSAEQLFDFGESSGTVQGFFSGNVSLSAGDQPGLEGWARLTGESGRWGPLSFDGVYGVVFFRGSRVHVESLEVTQKGGGLRARGEFVRRALTPAIPGTVWDWRMDGEGNRFSVGPTVFSSSWTTRGTRYTRRGTGTGDFSSPDFTLFGSLGEEGSFLKDGVSFGKVMASFSWTPILYQVEELVIERGLRGKGHVGSDGQSLTGELKFESLSLADLFPALPVSKDNSALGRLDGHLTLSGDWPNPRGEMNVALSGADWKGLPLKGNLRALWNKTLEIPHLSFTFPGGDGLFRGSLSPDLLGKRGATVTEWEGKVHCRSLDPVLRSMGIPVPWTGSFDSTLVLSGEVPNLQGRLVVEGQVGQSGAPLSKWTSRFFVSGSTVSVEEAVLSTAEGSWRVEAGSRLFREKKGQWGFQLKNQLRNIHVGPLQLFGGLALRGKGDVLRKTISGRLGASSLWINQQVFDQDLAEVRWSRGRLDFFPIPQAPAFVQGAVRLDRWPQTFFEELTLWETGRPLLVLEGEMGPDRWDFTLGGKGLPAEALLSLADFDWPISGPWNVRVRGVGSLSAPNVRAEVVGGPGKIGPLPYDRLEANTHWVGDQIDVQEIRLSRRKGYLLTGSGRFPLRAGEGRTEGLQMNLRLTDGKLALLKEVWPICRSARGGFYGDVRVEPGTPIPQVTGSFHVKDGRLNLKTYAPKVRDLHGEISFQNDRARVENARARVGRGWIEMAGDIGIQGLSPVEYDLFIRSEGKRGLAVEVPQLSVPPGPLLGRLSFLSDKLKDVSYGEPHLSLRIQGLHGKHLIAGEVDMEGVHFTYPPSADQGGGIPGPRWWQNFWRMASWDLILKTGKETWYRNEFLNARLDGELHLEGQPGSWRANGRLDSEEGVVNYLGQLFQIKRGLFELVTDTRTALGSVGVQPYVAGEADRTVSLLDSSGIASEDTISMVVDRSLLSEIQPRFVSRNDPSMSSDRVAMRALGIATEQPVNQTERDQLFRAGLVQLVGSSAAPLANRLAQKFGIGMISAIYEPSEANGGGSPAVSATEGNASAKSSPLSEYLRGAGAAARIQLTDSLSGVYKVKLDEAKGQSYFHDQIELILRLKGSLYLRASTELDTQSVLGQPPERRIGLENQWRFGLPRRRQMTLEQGAVK
ncbi:MAG: translocation/assembly module TamB domain-containing protein [Elusimicrobia bacterium]|nr:translocation/assembly module TamB domain-containing protein [Elusimicrobiota bacterium]